MKKIVLTFGLISGAISSLMMSTTILFADRIGVHHSYFLGYTIIVLSFLLVFFGIRSYRDEAGNGQITFTRAFMVGIAITLISCVCYVVTWEILYFNFLPDFWTKYSAETVEKMQAAGATSAAVAAKAEEMKKFKQSYDKVLVNSAMTFLEPFPVGLVITLISAAILRKKPRAQAGPTPQPAS